MSGVSVEESYCDGSSDSVELPEGWTPSTLGDIITPSKEKLEPKEFQELPYLSLEHVEGGTNRLICRGRGRDARSTKSAFAPGDVIYGKLRPYLNKVCMPDFVGVCSTDFLVFKNSEAISNRLLMYFLSRRETVEFANHHASGIELPRVRWSELAKLVVPLPPLAEQTRIVAQVESLQAKVNAVRERLAKVPAILKRFRQSVLAAACSGELTSDWRETQTDVVPARALLEQIKAKVCGQSGPSRSVSNFVAMFSEFFLEDAEADLPATWVACRVGHVGVVCNGSTPSRKRPEFWGGVINWVSSGEVQNNIITKTREQITDDGFANSSCRILPPGTVLIAMIGEGKTRGQTATLAIPAAINQNVAAVDLSHGEVSPTYLWYWFRFQYLLTRQEGAGSGPPALNCQRVRELPLALPPLLEQQEIVRRVDVLFSLADAIEQRVQAATKRADALTQSILRSAFRGELVPTEAELARAEGRDYEPASVLLERIRAQRKAEPGRNGSPRQRKARQKRQAPESDEAGRLQARANAVEPAPRLEVTPAQAVAAPVPALTALADYSTNELMAEFRAALWGAGQLTETDLLREVARRLGYQRLGKNVHAELKSHLRAAIRRRIVERDGEYVVCPTSIFRNYDTEFLRARLKSVMALGREYTRDDVIHNLAEYLGYRNVTAAMRDHMKSVFNSAIRHGELGYRGQWIWREG